LVVEDRANQARLALAFEGPPAGEHLVEHSAEREDVGARVHHLAFQLLGRHVLQRPEDCPLQRQRRTDRRHREIREADHAVTEAVSRV
jgi:hypothetical protein